MSKFLALCARVPALAVIVMLSGCAGYVDLAPGTVKKIECPSGMPVVERQQVTVPSQVPEVPPPADYVIGLNDVLYININGKPEFLISGPNLNSKIQGSRVGGNGDIRIPLVGPGFPLLVR